MSPVAGKPVRVALDGGRLTSDAGVLLLAEIERKLQIAERLAGCIADPRAPERVRHSLVEMIRFRALMIAAGYPDANDCDALRDDPAFKMAVGRLPVTGPELCSQATLAGPWGPRSPTDVAAAESADEDHADSHDGCASPAFWPAPLRGLDRPPADGRWLSCFATASSRCRGASCSISRDSLGGHARPGARRSAAVAGPVLCRDRIEGLLVFNGVERNRVHYVFGLVNNRALLDRTATLAEDTAVRRAEEDADKVRNFHDFRYAARSWKDKERRVIARIEATRQGSDTRFVVTNLTGTPRWLYEVLYCSRGPSAASWPRSLRESDRASADARSPRT